MLAVERDVKLRNMNFPKLQRGGGLIGRGIYTDKYGKFLLSLLGLWSSNV